MKIALLVFASLTLHAMPARSQEFQGCWMQNRNGQVVSLTGMCRDRSFTVPAPTPAPRSITRVRAELPTLTEDDLIGAADHYAYLYCDFRSEGQGHVRADRAARGEVFDLLLATGEGLSDRVGDFYRLARAEVVDRCPEFGR